MTAEKLALFYPEIALFAAACVVMVLGLSRSREVRGMCAPFSALALLVSASLALWTSPDVATALPGLPLYVKVMAAGVGVLLIMLLAGAPDRDYEDGVAAGAAFDPVRSTRGEYYAFFLFSIAGLMLCASAADLVMLFLALELVSLPTYVMVALASGRNRSMEAGIKYFFLGAMGAATFLYGFALIYGATGATSFAAIELSLSRQSVETGGPNALAILGVVMAFLGICVKIAAVPMHFFTPDVYQGAASPVAGFLAFVPKAAGFVALIVLLSTVGWRFGAQAQSLPEPIYIALWIVAVLTMTIGNCLAVVQASVKRILAYSSIAHSGYMLVGLLAGPGPADAQLVRNGLSAVLFYLLAYGVMNLGAFAVLACLERRGQDGRPEEIDQVSDLRGLCRTHPALGWTMVISAMGLLGLPPLLGFMGKLPLFTSAIGAGEYVLVVIFGLNSAIAAYYYLRLAAAPLLETPDPAGLVAPVHAAPFPARRLAAVASAVGVVALAVFAAPLGSFAHSGGEYHPTVYMRDGAAAPPRSDAPGDERPVADAATRRAAEPE